MIRLLARDIAAWRSRPEIVAVSLATLAMVAGLWVTGFLAAQAAGASLPGPTAARDAAQRVFLAPYRFPASVVWIVASGVWLFFGTFYVGAATTGGDFAWGTIRTALLAGRGRTEFVVVRLAFVVLLGLVLLAVEVSLGAALPTLLSTGDGPPVPATGLFLAVAAGLLGVAMYGSAGVCAGVLSRDRATPLMLGAAAVVGQSILSTLPFWNQNEVLQWVPRLFPSNALGSVFARSEEWVRILEPFGVPSYLQAPWAVAAGITIAWIVVFSLAAVVSLRRADITA